NRGGAGGNIAIDMVAHAAPNGYTMLLGGPVMVLNRLLYSSVSYDPFGDFAPVSMICTYGSLLVVPAASPIRSLREFISHAKANPGKVTFGSPGVGTTSHLAGELLKH